MPMLPRMPRSFFAVFAVFAVFAFLAPTGAQDPGRPPVGMVDVPTVKILRGYTVPEFEAEMQSMNQALGVACGHCHTRNNFASDENPRKAVARRMIEMTQAINKQFFPEYRAQPEESRLGKVTCFTCHQGSVLPKAPER
jgi:photosynthetic reaction center cytochrome c subunit